MYTQCLLYLAFFSIQFSITGMICLLLGKSELDIPGPGGIIPFKAPYNQPQTLNPKP